MYISNLLGGRILAASKQEFKEYVTLHSCNLQKLHFTYFLSFQIDTAKEPTIAVPIPHLATFLLHPIFNKLPGLAFLALITYLLDDERAQPKTHQTTIVKREQFIEEHLHYAIFWRSRTLRMSIILSLKIIRKEAMTRSVKGDAHIPTYRLCLWSVVLIFCYVLLPDEASSFQRDANAAAGACLRTLLVIIIWSENLASFCVSVRWSCKRNGLLAEILSKGKLHKNLVQPSSEKTCVS